ncbi:hypothetical protein E2320_008008 [Naja naja]|nr:hypothetical protein E2320_008008 [Naja naja]
MHKSLAPKGQESAGIVTSDGESAHSFKVHKGMGLVNHVFSEDSLKKLYVSNLGIGHTRYSTSGVSVLDNCQPFVVETLHGKIAVAHNGELTNAMRLRRKLMRHGVGLSTSSDSELITQLLAFTPPLEQDDTPDWVARYYREVMPGEIVKISKYDVQTLDIVPRPQGDPAAFCIFEYVYFARPDSIFEGQMVYSVRRRCGQQLAIEAPVEADLVSTVPESATPAALGYAQKCGLPYIEVLCKNRYVGRTFIQPNMRGNTISPIIKLLRESGAKEVIDSVAHCPLKYDVVKTLRSHNSVSPHRCTSVASPPIKFPCYMGINIPTKEELIANRPEFKDLAGYIEQDDTPDWVARIKNLMNETPTSYSLLMMHKDIIYAVRKNNAETEGWVVSSESCSFLSIGAEYYREVMPGDCENIQIDVQTLDIVPRPQGDPAAFCILNMCTLCRPDSIFEGQMVYSVRRRCQQLAIEAPVEADLVSTVPESATPAALGYAQKCGLPYIEVLCKNRYVGRTFIQPNMRLRQLGVAKKFGVLSDNFRGKRVVLIDDSIVRGNTISPIIKLLRESGAKEVHIRVASPPIKFPCYMGINIPTKEELIANRPEFKDLAGYIGADSVVYLSVEGLVSSVQESIKARQDHENNLKMNKFKSGKIGHCTACLVGKYPVELEW